MKYQQKAAATAILGLAFGGISSNVTAESSLDVADASFAAVNNLVNLHQDTRILEPQPDGIGHASASGAPPIGEVSATTGNTNTVQMSETILTACAGGANTGTAFQEDCNALVGAAATDSSGSAAAMARLTPDQVLAQNNVASQQVKVETAVVGARMLGLRLAAQGAPAGMSEALAAGLLYGHLGGAASADALGGQSGLFLSVKYLDGTQDRNRYSYGYNTDGWNLTAGGDYRFGNNLIGGLMVNYTQSSANYDGNKGRMNMDGWGLGAYGTYFLDNGIFFEGIAGYNWNHYDLKRRINYTLDSGEGTTRVNQTAQSSPSGGVFHATLGTGYSLNREAYTITPKLSLNYVRNSVGSYGERMSDPNASGGTWALAYDSRDYTSFTSRLGVIIANAISTGSGVFVPQFSLDWVHEFDNDQQAVGARFIYDLSATPLAIWTTKPDHNYFDLGVGISGQFANGRSAFISYNTLLGYEDISQYTITAGVRLEF